MQQLTEGQTNEPRREDASSSESNTSVVEMLPEEIPDELGHVNGEFYICLIFLE